MAEAAGILNTFAPERLQSERDNPFEPHTRAIEEQSRHCMNEDDSKYIFGLLQSESAELTSDYAKRGRRFKGLTHEALTDQWIASFRAVAINYTDAEARRLVSDVMAEYALRGFKPPYHLVKSELDNYRNAAVSLIKHIQESDPDRFAEIARVFAGRVDAFKSKRTS